MKLYQMSKKTTPILPKRGMVHCKGGYVPLLLGMSHGTQQVSGGTIPVPRPVELGPTKNVLGGLTLQDPRSKKTKFINI